MGGYRSGRIPKALKILPHLANWEELLLLTEPHQWTPQAMYQVTRIFSSSLNEAMAQRFYSSILLPSVRAYIREYRNLDPNLFMAIRKAMFKQKAFMKGFLLPLCEEQDCSLREALIIGSLLQKTSIKVIHAAVAMAKIALMPYSGACSLFLRIFFDKQYQLPMGCIDASVQHFGSFVNDDRRQFPVLWHQSLLSFVQRYKNELTPDQVDLLYKVSDKHNHNLLTPEIRRELLPLRRKNELTKERQAKRLSTVR
jgi:essential nuclear protein 1